jgi:HAMP domain-containing protein
MLSAVAALGAWTLVRSAARGATESVDDLGFAAARLLASIEVDWWEEKHGTAEEMRKHASEVLEDEEKAVSRLEDGPEKDRLKAELELAKGKFLKVYLADRRGVDDLLRSRNRERLKQLALQEALIGADIYDLNRRPTGVGRGMPDAVLEKRGGGYRGGFHVVVDKATGRAVRGAIYLWPIVGRRLDPATNQPLLEGFAGVALSAESAYALAEAAEGKALAAGGAVLGAGLLGALLAALMAAPLRRTLRDAEEFARGNFDHRPSAPGGGEVGAIGRALGRMALTARDREGAALAKAASAAAPPPDHRPLVAAALAPAPPLRVPGWEIEGTSRACLEIAGDFFDYSPAAGGRLSCILVETSLRGLPAAFVAAEVRGLFRGLAPHHDSASLLLDSIGALAGPRLPEDAEVHATVMVCDPATGRAGIARAGKANPPILLRAQSRSLEKVEIEGPPVRRSEGAGTGASAAHVEADIGPRDRLSFVSDGLFRVRNQRKEKFGEQRLDGLVLKFGPMNSTAFVNMVVNEVDLFHEGAPQRDDITVLTVRRIQ